MNYNVESFEIRPDNLLYFTSDLHFFHERIIEFTGRPTTFENLNNWIIQQCNSVIPEANATVLHLGDMFFKSTNEEAVDILSQLNGNWWFILGNHDNPSKMETVINTVNKQKGTQHRLLGWYHRLLVKEPAPAQGQKMPKKLLILCHFPIEDWEGMSRHSAMIHGHLHGGTSSHERESARKLANRFDVGIDNSHTFTPFSYAELKRILRKTRVEDEQDSC